MISYVNFSIAMHGLNLKDDQEVETLRTKIEEAVRAIHPGQRDDSDVEVEVEEHSGTCDDKE
jgi:hypothetical protein